MIIETCYFNPSDPDLDLENNQQILMQMLVGLGCDILRVVFKSTLNVLVVLFERITPGNRIQWWMELMIVDLGRGVLLALSDKVCNWAIKFETDDFSLFSEKCRVKWQAIIWTNDGLFTDAICFTQPQRVKPSWWYKTANLDIYQKIKICHFLNKWHWEKWCHSSSCPHDPVDDQLTVIPGLLFNISSLKAI